MSKSEFPRLNRRAYFLVLAASLAVFFVGFGPVWDHPFEIDAAVYWSYAAVPILVLLAALLTQRLSPRGFFLDTLEISVWKFGVTYLFATLMWLVAGSPPPRTPSVPPAFQDVTRTRPRPTKLDPSTLGELWGIVPPEISRQSLVYISAGLEDIVFEVPETELELVNDGKEFIPHLLAVQLHQPLRMRSGDGTLHTVQGYTSSGRLAFNFPMLPTPDGTVRRIDDPVGLVELRCSVSEFRNGRMLVLHHPFVTQPDLRREFSFSGIPNGTYTITVLDAEGVSRSASVEVRARERTDVSFGDTEDEG